MTRTEALTEDLRRIGVGFIVVDAFGAFFSGGIGVVGLSVMALFGIVLLGLGYWLCTDTE